MAKINDEYDIGAAFEAIENELISSMIRNFENHKQEELDEKKHWSMWQTEMSKSLEKYKHDNQKKYGCADSGKHNGTARKRSSSFSDGKISGTKDHI